MVTPEQSLNMYGINNELVKVLVDNTSSVEGPSLAKMLLPKHNVPLSQQYSATEIRTNEHGLSPQTHTIRSSTFEKQLTTLFSANNLTDDLGNFRPGEKLPPPPGDLNKRNQTTSNNNNNTNNNNKTNNQSTTYNNNNNNHYLINNTPTNLENCQM